jgi:bifunctional UDP-N-acetylglucosamine pyrophosphorylase/glucosamine-1-phosphate N-acetyltransferase
MQAVILAAGKSTRCYPLTLTRPKPLLKVANKTIIEHTLEQLKGLVEEVIIVVGYKKEMIEYYLGKDFQGLPLKYVHQDNPQGPGEAIMLCQEHLKDKFIVINGDDLYARENFEKCLKHQYCVLATEVDDISLWGVFGLNEDGSVKSFQEKPPEKKPGLANTGVYVFDKRIFDFKLELSPRGELEGTDYITHLVKAGEKVHCEKVEGYWLPTPYPWSLLEANEFLVGGLKESRIEGLVEEGAIIKGKIVLGKDSVIRSGAYIDGNVFIGEKTTLGPNCLIRGKTSIGNNCYVGNAVEVKNCVIGDGTKIGHLSYCADSIIGGDCNFGAGTITANLRHDKADVKVMIKGEKIDAGRRKLGVIMGDKCKTGIHTSFYPGRKMGPETFTLPGEVVKADKE